MKAHFHITVKKITVDQLKEIATELNLKPTLIDMIKNGEGYQDRMLTGYQADDTFLTITPIVYRIEEMGYEIARYKIEQQYKSLDEMIEDLDLSKISSENYLEFHLKYLKGKEILLPTFQYAASNNPIELDYEFINFRAYTVKDFIRIVSYITFNSKDFESIHMERLIYDSLKSHDSGWME